MGPSFRWDDGLKAIPAFEGMTAGRGARSAGSDCRTAGDPLKRRSAPTRRAIDARGRLVQTGGMIRAPHAVAAAILGLALSGCGFHLRNALTLPEDLGPVRVISADPYSPLGQSLSQALARVGATPAADADVDVATLEVISEKWGSRPISIDQFGRAQEYQLRYAVVFGLRAANGDDVLPRETIELSRDYVSSPANPTGAEGEQELLAKEMRREMTASILRRIDAAERATTAPARQSETSPASQPDTAPLPAQAPGR